MSSAPKKKKEFVLDGDVIAPREKKQRYRIYRVKDAGDPELIATCRTRGGVGVTLCELGAEGEFLNYTVGVLDGMDHKNEKGEWVGKWLILPWVEKDEEETTEIKLSAKLREAADAIRKAPPR